MKYLFVENMILMEVLSTTDTSYYHGSSLHILDDGALRGGIKTEKGREAGRIFFLHIYPLSILPGYCHYPLSKQLGEKKWRRRKEKNDTMC
jgi:hypothetical protein